MLIEIYTCEELLDTLKRLLATLTSPTVLVGGSTTMKADDMQTSRSTIASTSQQAVMNQIRYWYRIYLDKGCDPIAEIESLISNPHIVVAGRTGFYKGRRVK